MSANNSVTAASDLKPIEVEKLFRDYLLDGAFDEMRTPDGSIRPHYRALIETLASLPHDELLRRKQSADLSFLTQVLYQVPSTAFEQSLFVIAESVHEIKHRIMPRRMPGSCGVIVGWQHHAVVDAFTEGMTLQGVAIDAALCAARANQERN